MDAVALGWANRMNENAAMSHNPDYSSQIPGGWMKSPGHRANIPGDVTDIGIAFIGVNGRPLGCAGLRQVSWPRRIGGSAARRASASRRASADDRTRTPAQPQALNPKTVDLSREPPQCSPLGYCWPCGSGASESRPADLLQLRLSVLSAPFSTLRR